MEILAIFFIANWIQILKVNNNGQSPVFDKAMALSMLQDAQTARGENTYAIFSYNWYNTVTLKVKMVKIFLLFFTFNGINKS